MKIDIQGRGKEKELLKMLAWIELLGSIGHTTDFKVCVDGDGTTQWKFKFESKEQQEQFDELKKSLLGNINKGTDIKDFSI